VLALPLDCRTARCDCWQEISVLLFCSFVLVTTDFLMNPDLVAFSFKEFLFSSVSIPFGPHFPVLCSFRKTRKHDPEHFPPFPAYEEAWLRSEFNFFFINMVDPTAKWTESCASVFHCLDWMRPHHLAMSWCPWERRLVHKPSLSNCLGEVTIQQWFVCLFVLLAVSLCSCEQQSQQSNVDWKLHLVLWMNVKKQKFSKFFLFLLFFSNLVFLLTLSKGGRKKGKRAEREQKTKHWIFLLLSRPLKWGKPKTKIKQSSHAWHC